MLKFYGLEVKEIEYGNYVFQLNSDYNPLIRNLLNIHIE